MGIPSGGGNQLDAEMQRRKMYKYHQNVLYSVLSHWHCNQSPGSPFCVAGSSVCDAVYHSTLGWIHHWGSLTIKPSKNEMMCTKW